MSRPLRVTWFAALAIFALCAVVGTLGWQWLALEREVATRRSTDSAEAALASLRHDLESTLQSSAASFGRATADDAERAPFARPSHLPRMVEAAVVFDEAGQAEPEGEDAVMRAAAAFARASTEPAWRLPMSSIESLAASQHTREALAAARQLTSRTSNPALIADALVMVSRLEGLLNDRSAADEAAARVFACCAAARDEYGMSFVLYAARQRLTIAQGIHDDAIVRDVGAGIRAVIAAGDLGSATDEDALRQIQSRWPDRPEIEAAVAAFDRTRRAGLERAAYVQRATAWLAEGKPQGIRIDGIDGHGGPALVAAVPGSRGGHVVMTLDPAAVAESIATWSAAHAAFDITLEAPGGVASASQPLARSALTSGPAPWRLAARVRASDPGADGRRQRLFLGAIGAAMLFAVLTGVLVVRDVSRELRLASLQSTFVAGVTHELKTPLTSIRLLAETLRHGRARPEQSAELLDTLVQEAERVTRLVDNVLSSSRIKSGTRVYARHPALLQDVVEAVRRRFESVLTTAGFRLTVAVDPSPLRASVDSDAFEQALLNLLTNAAKYTDASAAPEIRLTLARHGQEAEARVEDRGRGIAAEDHRRIFDRFYRASDVQSDTAGAGLGLTLVKHFADAHGGRVSVESQLGRGSAFSIWLPLVED